MSNPEVCGNCGYFNAKPESQDQEGLCSNPYIPIIDTKGDRNPADVLEATSMNVAFEWLSKGVTCFEKVIVLPVQ